MSANEWCMWAGVSSPQTSPLTRTRIRASAALNSFGRDAAWSEPVRPVPVLRLAGPHAHGALLPLDVPRRQVVPDRVAEDAAGGVLGPRVAGAPADPRRGLERGVEPVGVARPRDLDVGADDRVRQALVVGRD